MIFEFLTFNLRKSLNPGNKWKVDYHLYLDDIIILMIVVSIGSTRELKCDTMI